MTQTIKDILSIVQQSIFIILFILLFACPSKINSVLTNAGFTKGSVMGFDWATQIQQSRDSLQLTNNQVTEVQKQLKNIVPQMKQLQGGNAGHALSDKEFQTIVNKLSDSLDLSVKKIDFTSLMLNKNIERNKSLLEKAKQQNNKSNTLQN